MTRDGVLVVSHDSLLNPDHTRARTAIFLVASRPGDPHALARRGEALRRGPPEAGTASRHLPQQRGMDGARIPTLAEVLELVQRKGAVMCASISRPSSRPTRRRTSDPETFAAAFAAAVREAGLGRAA